jgi:hypothetical protein
VARVYLPSSEKPKKGEAPEEAEPVTGRVYLPPSQSPRAAAKAAKAAAKAEAKARAEAEAAPRRPRRRPRPATSLPPDPTPSTVGDQPRRQAGGRAGRERHPRGVGRVRPHVEGAGDGDLVDEDGKPLGRDALREKYGTPAE